MNDLIKMIGAIGLPTDRLLERMTLDTFGFDTENGIIREITLTFIPSETNQDSQELLRKQIESTQNKLDALCERYRQIAQDEQ